MDLYQRARRCVVASVGESAAVKAIDAYMEVVARSPRPVRSAGGIDFPPYIPPPDIDGGVAERGLRDLARAIAHTITADAPLDPWAERYFLEAMVASRNGSARLCQWHGPTQRNPYGCAVEIASARAAREWVDAHY